MNSDHWRAFFDNKYLGNWDLPEGVDVPAVIERVEAGELTAAGGRTDKKPLCFFRGKSKPLALNKTNAKAIAGMYGNNTSAWRGQPVALYVTTTQMAGETVPCIRVRPTPPKKKPGGRGGSHTPDPQAERPEPRETIIVRVRKLRALAKDNANTNEAAAATSAADALIKKHNLTEHEIDEANDTQQNIGGEDD